MTGRQIPRQLSEGDPLGSVPLLLRLTCTYTACGLHTASPMRARADVIPPMSLPSRRPPSRSSLIDQDRMRPMYTGSREILLKMASDAKRAMTKYS